MKTIRFKQWLLGTFFFFSMSAMGADIDLFAGITPTGADAPAVLFVVDTAADFSASNSDFRCSITSDGVVKTDATGTAYTGLDRTNGGVEQCALYSVIKAMDTTTTKLKMGVMFFNSNMKTYDPQTNLFSQDCVGGIGGCVGMPIVPINSTTKPRILEWIRKWVSNTGDYNIKGSNNRGDGQTMQETWAYLFGKTGISGRIYSGTDLSACGAKNVIYLGNAYKRPTKPSDSVNNATSPSKALDGSHSVIGVRAIPVATVKQLAPIRDVIKTSCTTASTTLETSEGKGAMALNWTQYMRDQGVTTFSIGVLGPNCDDQYAAFMDKMGSLGGGGFIGTSDFSSLVLALSKNLGQIQSVNSVFAAVSLPVSVNTQGSYLNQVFVGMFRPDKLSMPRWNGNLKQYKMGMSGTSLILKDADNKAAINPLTGFITECARSYWTPTSVDDYWGALPSGGCTDLTLPTAKSSNYPDGNVVEKGAQAYLLRTLTPSSRIVKTCSDATCPPALVNFDVNNNFVSQLLLNNGGVDRVDLINWARGENNKDDELNMVASVMRASAHGDVVHSRSVPVNHGTDAQPSIVVYYGGNDGLLRAINGNRNDPLNNTTGDIVSGGTTYHAGAELWSFMPPEFYGKISRLRNNSPNINYSGTTDVNAMAKDYSFDGPITALKNASATYIYATMRRGGRNIYAFNVTAPASPTLLWKKGCPNLSNDTGCSNDENGDFRAMGQTWSSLKALYATGYGSGVSPMLIMGGGYDACEDYDNGIKNHNCTSSKGNKVLVLDAATGALLKAFPTDRAVIADSTLVLDSNGKIKYAYTADLGGNVYRMSFGSVAPSDWSITKIASLGCDTVGACDGTTRNRKFAFAPSVVTTDNVTYYVMLGSGDREKPVKQYIASNLVANYFFMLKDKPADATWLSSENANCSANVLCKSSLQRIQSGATPSDAELALKKGWYLDMTSTEQVVTSSVTIFGVVYFSTHQPAVTVETACKNTLGTTSVYNVSYLNASSSTGNTDRSAHVIGDGLPPSPVAGLVKLDGATSMTPFCIGCSKSSPLEASLPGSLSTVAQPKGRLYWYIQK